MRVRQEEFEKINGLKNEKTPRKRKCLNFFVDVDSYDASVSGKKSVSEGHVHDPHLYIILCVKLLAQKDTSRLGSLGLIIITKIIGIICGR